MITITCQTMNRKDDKSENGNFLLNNLSKNVLWTKYTLEQIQPCYETNNLQFLLKTLLNSKNSVLIDII